MGKLDLKDIMNKEQLDIVESKEDPKYKPYMNPVLVNNNSFMSDRPRFKKQDYRDLDNSRPIDLLLGSGESQIKT